MPKTRRVVLLLLAALAGAVLVPTLASGDAGAWDIGQPDAPPAQPLGPLVSATNLGAPGKAVVVSATTDTVVSALGVDATFGTDTTLTVEVRPVTGTTAGGVVATASAPVVAGEAGFHDVPIDFTFVAGQRYDVRFTLPGGWGFGVNTLRLYNWDNKLFDPLLAYGVGPFVVIDGGGGAFSYSYGYTGLPHVHIIGAAIDSVAPDVDLRVADVDHEARNGWYNADSSGTDGVTLEVSAIDESAVTHLECSDRGRVVLDQPSGAAATLTLGDGLHSVSCSATDEHGNVGSTESALTLRIDQTPPTLSPRVAPNPARQGQDAAAFADAVDTYGVADEACDAPSTQQLGHHEVACGAHDVAGNAATGVAGYDVLAAFDGFFAPVDTAGTNRAKAGSAVPLKFSLGGWQGLDVLAAGSPSVHVCGATTASPAAGKLTYDADTGTYVYVWKTDKGWSGSCREVTVRLADGSAKSARFSFT